MGHDIHLTAYYGFSTFAESPPLKIKVGMNDTPSSEDLHDRLCSRARIPLREISQYPHGHIFDVEEIVQPKDPDCTARLDVGNDYMMAELTRVLDQDFTAKQSDKEYPFRLISRRHNNFMNSTGTQIRRLNRGKPYNPTYMHPNDIAALGLNSGDSVVVSSRYDSIPSIIEEDRTLRPGVIQMHHAFGGLVEDDDKFLSQGSNIARLIRNELEFDPISGIPRMGDIPVKVSAPPG
jgi:anaerobic selenocysteine-containing dehydrogenase